MVNWESNTARGGRPPTKGRVERRQRGKKCPSQGEAHPSGPPLDPLAPRGSPIAKRLAKHALQTMDRT